MGSETGAPDVFELGGQTFGSRLIMGTGGAPSLEILERALLVHDLADQQRRGCHPVRLCDGF